MRFRATLLTLTVLCAASAASAAPKETVSSPTIATAGSDGHPTHPVWYHDSTLVKVGSHLFVAWNTDHGSVEARARSLKTSQWDGSAVRVSSTSLDCGCVDSTGQNPNRHDVPTLFADPAGRVYALYGGGTASKTGDKTGPFFRAGRKLGTITAWRPEVRLSVPGAAYDLETVRDNHGVTHIVGQQGDNPSGAGSLLYLRLHPGTTSSPGSFGSPPYGVLVRGGKDPSACAWQSTPGCNVYVIGRIAVGPPDRADPGAPSPLYVAWGWSEKNLSNTCGDPAGFCNHGLYVARSLDGGDTWTNVGGTAPTDIGAGPIPYDDADYDVRDPSMDVGLFKAITVTGSYPGRPSIAYQPEADVGTGSVAVATWDPGSSTWGTQTVDMSRSWNDHLVMRSANGKLFLWSDIAQTGSNAGNLDQWTGGLGHGWTRTQLSVGRNWFLTGRSISGGEALMWRAPDTATATRVRIAVVPVP